MAEQAKNEPAPMLAKATIEEGLCPMCGAELHFGWPAPQDNYIVFQVTCGKCPWKGSEWMKAKFDGYTTTNIDDDTVNVEPNDQDRGDYAALCKARVSAAKCDVEVDDGVPRVLIRVEGGLVQGVEKTDPRIEIVVRDYDVEGIGSDDPGWKIDIEGNECVESTW